MNVQLRQRGTYTFGPFRLDPTRRTLVDANGEVTLTARLFDTLLCLVQNSDRLVEREELAYAVWAERTVSEGNLQKAISSLRKVLQKHAPDEVFIRTIAGRGFRFAVPVTFEPDITDLSIADPFGPPGSALPDSQMQWWRRQSLALYGLVILAVVLSVLAVALRPRSEQTTGPSAFAPAAHSVAVMAFTNLSGDRNQEYFSDGVSEELINALGRIGRLKVAARLSSFSFKGKSETVADIARQLDVGSVLEGSIRRDGSRLRVTAQLIDARTGYQLWSRDFDRDQGDLLNVQDDIAEAVATSLKIVLASDDVVRLNSGNTNNSKAWDTYLHGVALRNHLVPENLRHALAYFDTAVALDPKFALAHAERASTLINFAEGIAGGASDAATIQRYREQALAEARQAVALAPRLGSAHAILAGADEELWRFVAAEAEYQRARTLAPGDSTIELRFARFEAAMGRPLSSLAAAQHAAELDPLSSGAFLALASNYTMAKRAVEAAIALKHAERLGLQGPFDVDESSQIALLKHDYATVRRLCADKPYWVQYYLAIADHALGDQAGAQVALARFKALQGDETAFEYAAIYAQWGDTDDALQWLETAYRLHDDGLIDMKTYWLLDPIRGTARFKAVEDRMNFPP